MTTSSSPLSVYLDWNVMQDVIDGRLPELTDCLSLGQDSGLALVPYSFEHVTEATRGLNVGDPRAEELLAGISAVTGDLYWTREEDGSTWESDRDPRTLLTGKAALEALEEEPLVAAMTGLLMPLLKTACRAALASYAQQGVDVSDLEQRIDALPPSMSAMSEIPEVFTQASRRARRQVEEAGFDPSRLGNVLPAEATRAIDELLAAGGHETSFAEMMAAGRRIAGDRELPPADAAAANAALASFGYRRDKWKVSDASVNSDGIHLEFASHADVFVTQDAKLRARAKAVMHGLGARTIVVISEEAVEHLRRAVGAG